MDRVVEVSYCRKVSFHVWFQAPFLPDDPQTAPIRDDPASTWRFSVRIDKVIQHHRSQLK
jgi:hypothetical protein